MNKMQEIKIEKITLNIGTGKEQARLEKGLKLLKTITNIKPVKTFSTKRIPTWGLRPGLPIGCKVTLRKGKAYDVLKRLIQARNNVLKESQFDCEGNIAFGIPEYIDIPEIEYDPEIGIIGLEVCVTLERPGFRIKKRRILRRRIPSKHRITRKMAIEFMKANFNIKHEEEE